MSLLVYASTVLPDLSIWINQGFDVSHPDHAVNEVSTKDVLILGISSNKWIGGATIEENLIRVEESLLVEEVLEVAIIKIVRTCNVQVSNKISWSIGQWTKLLLGLGKRRVNIALIIYARYKTGAPCLPYGVSSWK